MEKITRKRINKLDYFVGVFVVAILNCAENKPALIEETNDSKRVQFNTNTAEYDVYVKYSRSMKSGPKKSRINYWIIPFSEHDYEKLCAFTRSKTGYKNYIAIVCANKQLTTTWIAVLDYDKVMHLFSKSGSPKNITLKVLRKGNGQKFYYGLTGDDENGYEACYFDFTKYFS